MDRSRNPVREGLERTGLYHSFRLPDGRILEGAMPLEFLEGRVASFNLPQDLRGKRVLDIGPWDGYFTFEMERRGAEVTAIDYADLDTFRALHRAYNSRARYLRLDLYELDPVRHGIFDIVLCLGVLYHLKHPLLALEKICAVTRDVAIIETVVVDGEARQKGVCPPFPYVEFYERDELAGQLDNWSGPTVNAVEALVRAAGFAEAEVLGVSNEGARVAAHRKWRNRPPDEAPAVGLRAVSSNHNRGRSFLSSKEEYLVLWCHWDTAEEPSIFDVYPEVDGYGIAPLSAAVAQNGLQVCVRMPPGLSPGPHRVRLKIGRSGWSDTREFFIDLPEGPPLKLRSVQDGVSWTDNQMDWAGGGWLTVWVDGLTAEADLGNTTVEIGGVPHLPEAVHIDTGQINVQLRPVVFAGLNEVVVVHRGARSGPRMVQVVGNPPAIRGLERLLDGA